LYGIHTLCRAITDASLGALLPHPFFLRLLLDILPTISITSTTCDHYFDLLNKLVSDSCAGTWDVENVATCSDRSLLLQGFSGGSPQQFVELFERLMVMIKSHPILEKRHVADVN